MRAVNVLLVAGALLAAPIAASAKTGAGVIPPSEKTAKAALDTSPRHGEMISIPLASADTTAHASLRAWIAYPERRDKAGVVILIHEIFGLTDWIRGVCDRLAGDGFIAIAPDLLSGMGPGGGGTEAFPSRDSVVQAIRALTADVTRERIGAVRQYATQSIPAANGKVATIGFCWGGAQSFQQAATDPPPAACVVYYGWSPDSTMIGNVHAPVLGLYGGDDARVTATVAPAAAALKTLGRTYETHVFAGAGHGFLRAQEDRDGANMKAAREAWPLTLAFLRKYLGK